MVQVLVCVSLMISDIEHLYMCLLVCVYIYTYIICLDVEWMNAVVYFCISKNVTSANDFAFSSINSF